MQGRVRHQRLGQRLQRGRHHHQRGRRAQRLVAGLQLPGRPADHQHLERRADPERQAGHGHQRPLQRERSGRRHRQLRVQRHLDGRHQRRPGRLHPERQGLHGVLTPDARSQPRLPAARRQRGAAAAPCRQRPGRAEHLPGSAIGFPQPTAR
ncbi:hypothetical protein SCOCK_430015 [Actinacidiphila cocklensis]|uniref:Uncharacterized protein n=1 Tax=Actinacidiphila cocklensis TaxID=887465 RepID=A0A9W4GTS6_9ACTN|nr:hypothetical protein SCOCK_430015 [Actinacidiphila cocklensis]